MAGETPLKLSSCVGESHANGKRPLPGQGRGAVAEGDGLGASGGHGATRKIRVLAFPLAASLKALVLKVHPSKMSHQK